MDDTTNNSGGFSKGSGGPFNSPCTNNCGGWTGAAIGYAGDMYYTPADGNTTANQWARWQAPASPSLLGSFYEVFVHVPSNNATSWQAPYTIVYEGGAKTASAVVDQYGLFNQWVSIGTYRMTGNDYLYTTDATQETFGQHCGTNQWCQLGVDAVKFVRRGTTYLPDLKPTGGWSSTWYLRNNGGGPASAVISYFDNSGTYLCGTLGTAIPSHGMASVTIPPPPSCGPNAIASAVVGANQDVAVVVIQQRSSPNASAAYVGVEQPRSQVHVPLLHKSNHGFYSDLFIQNTGVSATNVTVEFKVSPGQPGSNCSTTYFSVPPSGRAAVSLSNVSCVGSTFVGAAFITNSAGHQLAVASTQHQANNSNVTISSHASGSANTIYAPVIQNNNYGWIAGIAFQNASGSTNTLSATYYNQAGGAPCRTDSYSATGARIAHIFSTPGANCTAVASAVYSGGTLPVSAIINQALPGTPQGTDYEAITTPTKNVYVPLWKNQSGVWISGLVVQNTTGQTANFTIRYYDAVGNPSGSPVTQTLPARAIYVASTTGVSNGSLMITANQAIAVVVNHALSISGDGAMSHIGLGR